MSDNKINQEKEERFYLDKFLSLIGINGAEIARGYDPPDFIVSYGDKRIAVEVTEFHSDSKGENGHPRRVIEEAWKNLSEIVTVERKSFTELNDISCYLWFDKFIIPSKKEHPAFAKELVSFVKDMLFQTPEVQIECRAFSSDKRLLSKYLKKLSIKRVGCYITWSWNYSGGMVGLNESEFKGVVERKLNSIGGTFDEIWLLIVSGVEISQCMGLPHIEELREFSTVNDLLKKGLHSNVFIYQYMFNRILEWTKQNGWNVKVESNSFNKQ